MSIDERSRQIDPRVALLDPKTLRRRAEQCRRLAENIPPGPNADTLHQIAADYQEQAERLEASSAKSRWQKAQPAKKRPIPAA
jgi:hypothetical protein